MQHPDIVLAFWKHCPAFRMPQPWWRIVPLADARVMGDNPGHLSGVLRGRFQADDLVASRIFSRSAENLTLNPKVSTPGTPLLGLHDPVSGDLYDIVTPRGLLIGEGLSLFAAIRDEHTRSALADWPQFSPFSEDIEAPLLLAATLEDVIVLRSFGLAAAPGHEMTEITPEAANRLRSELALEIDLSATTVNAPIQHAAGESVGDGPGVSAASLNPRDHGVDGPPGDCPDEADIPQADDSGSATAPDNHRIGQPTLVCWSPATLSHTPPETCTTVLCELRKREEEFDLLKIFDWNAGAETIIKIQSAAAAGNVPLLRTLIGRSLVDECTEVHSVLHPMSPSPRPPIESLHDALDRLREATKKRSVDGMREATAEYWQLVNSLYVRPIASAAANKHDVAETTILGLLESKVVEHYELLLKYTIGVTAEKTRVIIPALEQDAAPIVEARIRDLEKRLRSVDAEVFKIAKEVRTWDRNALFPPFQRPINSRN
jgi:hypothetical protein